VIPRFDLTESYSISRVIKGGWHLAGGHGAIESGSALRDMASFVDAGITTFDCADIYTGVESLIGQFLATYPAHARQVQVQTKFVPDLSALSSVDRRYVERVIDRSLSRLGVERLDLVQFHWWDFAVPRHVEVALELERLRRAGKIRHLGVTNFDTARLAELTAAGIPIVSHQLQYSLLDDRVNHGMREFCQTNRIFLLCYGTVCGGFLSERWLGQPEPAVELGNRSLTKYKLVIDDFGGWESFQSLLRALQGIAAKNNTDIASVASRFILDRPQVAGVIIGAVNASHLHAHSQMGRLTLSETDLETIAAVTSKRCGPTGDVYELERDRHGRHGRIMKYDLNVVPA
jgi:aryl-alcohol dehydrogenase-like predicted oxidoreductase